MTVKRKPLPIKVADELNRAVLKEYRSAVSDASARIKTLLKSQSSVSSDEAVLQKLEKSLTGGSMYLEEGQRIEVEIQGEWKEVLVKSFINGVLKITRDDGAVRVVSDLNKVRVGAEQLPPGIVMSRFNVLIPQGTTSYEVEKGLEPITELMNRTPLRVNQDTFLRNLKRVSEEFAVLEKACQEESGNPHFRPNSPKDCFEEFSNKRGLPLGRVGASGTPSIDKDVLQNLVNLGDPLAKKVMDAREVLSHLSQLRKWAPIAEAGFVQAKWDQYGQPHGRYTSEEPNLQNRVLEIRETIEPSEGYSFLSVDWGMAEYVTWASLSKDAYLSDIFNSGRDLHAEMGAGLIELNPSRSLGSDSVRKFGKTNNFAILYRMQPWTLAKSLGVSVQEAEGVMDAYRRKAPVASTYSDKILQEAARRGYVETFFGRRRYCPDLAAAKGAKLHELQKTIWHHHNAGTAAELLKAKMCLVDKELKGQGYKHSDVRVAMNMHDEIIYEVKDDLLYDVKDLVYFTMLNKMPGFLPFTVDARVGKNWLQISK